MADLEENLIDLFISYPNIYNRLLINEKLNQKYCIITDLRNTKYNQDMEKVFDSIEKTSKDISVNRYRLSQSTINSMEHIFSSRQILKVNILDNLYGRIMQEYKEYWDNLVMCVSRYGYGLDEGWRVTILQSIHDRRLGLGK